ncbi:MAG: MATE family efflux transporter [Bacillota bacterium]|nr:MATE family efflux transporter [Bacillota bacterium]
MRKKKDKNIIQLDKPALFSNKFLVKLLWPLFVEQFLLFAVGLVDSMMVASVGEAAVSAVSLVDSIIILMINIMAALATGGAIIVGQYLGQKKNDEAKAASDQLVLAALLISLLIIAVMYVFKNGIMALVFGDIEADVSHYCNIYYLIVTASIPFISIYNAGAALFRSIGNSKITMRISIVMNLINVVGNAVLIFGFGCGVEGVAIPTLVSRIVAAVAIYMLLRNPELIVHISKKPVFKPNWGYIKKILKIGVPNGVENSMFQLGKLILLSMIATFGTSAIAANAVGNAIAMVGCLSGMAMNLGVVPVISRCVGAGDYQQARFYTHKLMKWTYVAMFIGSLLVWFCLPLFLKIYGLSDETAELAFKILTINCFSAICIWPLSFTLPNILRAAGDVTFTMLVCVLSMWIFRIFCAYFMGVYMGLGLIGVWTAMIVDWAVRTVFFIARYKGGKWKKGSVV